MTRTLVILDDPPHGTGRSYNALLGGLLAADWCSVQCDRWSPADRGMFAGRGMQCWFTHRLGATMAA
jgi:hypothetical protein